MKAKPELNGMIGNCIAFDKSWGPQLIGRDESDGIDMMNDDELDKFFFNEKRIKFLAYQNKL